MRFKQAIDQPVTIFCVGIAFDDATYLRSCSSRRRNSERFDRTKMLASRSDDGPPLPPQHTHTSLPHLSISLLRTRSGIETRFELCHGYSQTHRDDERCVAPSNICACHSLTSHPRMRTRPKGGGFDDGAPC